MADDQDSLLFNIACFVAGLFVLEYGADRFVDNTAALAARLNVSPTLVGLLTCGAEWEELVVVAVAVGRNEPSLALGNLMGSSIANILASFSLGLLCLRDPVFDRSSKIYSCALFGLTSVFVVVLYVVPSYAKWLAGVALTVAFLVYVASVASLIYKGTLTAPEDDSDSDSDSDGDGDGDSDGDSDGDMEMKLVGTDDDSDDDEKQGSAELRPLGRASVGSSWTASDGPEARIASPAAARGRRRAHTRVQPLWPCLGRLLVGFGALMLSSYIIASSASSIGAGLGLSGTVVGATIVSVATTLPEKFVAVLGGMRRQPGILVANTVGSNIFLATLCAGVLFIWGDAERIAVSFTLFEAMTMWTSAALLLLVVLCGGRRWMGAVALGLYLAFLGVELATGRRVDAD